MAGRSRTAAARARRAEIRAQMARLRRELGYKATDLFDEWELRRLARQGQILNRARRGDPEALRIMREEWGNAWIKVGP